MPQTILKIGELSQRTGVATSALRYYEELGLIPATQRQSGRRLYDEAAIELVGVIVVLRDIGFSLAEIGKLFGSRSRPLGDWRVLAQKKLADLDERIERAQVARVALQHALRCRHPDLRSCPNFAGVLGARLAGQTLKEAHAHSDPKDGNRHSEHQ